MKLILEMKNLDVQLKLKEFEKPEIFEKEKQLEEYEYSGEEDSDILEYRDATIVSDGIYTGQWIKGTETRQGRGKLVRPNGSLYQGMWLDSSPNGLGRTIYSNCNVYIGEWKDG